MGKESTKDITDAKILKVLSKPIERDTVATGNDSHLYRSVEKALGADVKELSEKYALAISQKTIGEVSEEFIKEVETKALDLGRAYVVRRILSKRKLLLDTAFDRAQNDPKGQSILLKLIDILLGNTGGNSRVTKKIITERKMKFEDIAKPPRIDPADSKHTVTD